MIDDKITIESRKQFAGELQNAKPELVELLRSEIVNDKSFPFYEGLLSGYAGAYAVLKKVPFDHAEEYLGTLIAVLADKVNEFPQ